MGRRRSTQRDRDEESTPKEKKPAEPSPPPPDGNAFYRVCEKCGKVLAGPCYTQAEIKQQMMLPWACEGGCDGQEEE